MSEQTHESASRPLSLPENPNLEWLRKEAKRRLEQLRDANPQAALAEAQFELAKQYGFPSWRSNMGFRVGALSRRTLTL